MTTAHSPTTNTIQPTLTSKCSKASYQYVLTHKFPIAVIQAPPTVIVPAQALPTVTVPARVLSTVTVPARALPMGICRRSVVAREFPTRTNAEEKLKMQQDAKEAPSAINDDVPLPTTKKLNGCVEKTPSANNDDAPPPKKEQPMRIVDSDAGLPPTTQNVIGSIEKTPNGNNDNVPLLKTKETTGGVDWLLSAAKDDAPLSNSVGPTPSVDSRK